ncbi:unknown [Eubacterium sp. CAG:786]|nr:unknown [Eubacterium sp. CAG:786]
MISEAHRICEIFAFPGGFLYLRGNQLLKLRVFLQGHSRALVSPEHFAVELVGLRRSFPNKPVDLRCGTAVDLSDFRGYLIG